MLTIRELQGKDEMMGHISVLHAIYPSLTVEEYDRELDQMLPHNYGQVAVFDDEICIGISGFWIGTKLWSGKYIEIDSFVVHEDFRGQKIGDILIKEVHKIAEKEGANQIVLDAFTTNFTAGKFYINHGFQPKGFHFVKILN